MAKSRAISYAALRAQERFSLAIAHLRYWSDAHLCGRNDADEVRVLRVALYQSLAISLSSR